MIDAGRLWRGRALIGATLLAGLAAATIAGPRRSEAATSSPAAGKAAYTKAGCGMCHTIGKDGGKLGPALDGEGKKHNKAWILAFLKDPRSKLPKGTMAPVKASAADLDAMANYLASLK